MSAFMSKVVAIIPARWGSTRFPGKALHGIAGKPLVRHVWDRCNEAKVFDQIIVATDDMRIAETVFHFGGEVAMTSPDHASGTDRVAEVARNLKKASIIFNIQGDEPMIEPALLRRLAKKIVSSETISIITAATGVSPEAARRDHVVKVVFDSNGNALYFSRSQIPFSRGAFPPSLHKHLGIYGYRRRALLDFVRLSPGILEQTEELEQLRALENGMKIRVIVSETQSIGVDTPEDANEVEKVLLRGFGRR
jgi:3-deoxy-manno-octulosonate cytidylyltransferase (CMP-KDO synthetase)